MSELGAFFERNLTAIVIFELAFAGIIICGIMNEEKLIAFEDRFIKAIRHRIRRCVFRLKVSLRSVARRVFIKVYGAYRRRRIAKCRRLAKSVGCEIRVRNSRL